MRSLPRDRSSTASAVDPKASDKELVDVTYTNVSLSDTTNSVTAPIAGTFTKVFFTFDK
ncbi:hypothetical protein [Kitasatospora camelliae]|uniref:Uncharacterized protein n=1 Tax=Kitasatospora camelliae TaxID=3156397 RepID=A0AAU8K573_9ACTN